MEVIPSSICCDCRFFHQLNCSSPARVSGNSILLTVGSVNQSEFSSSGKQLVSGSQLTLSSGIRIICFFKISCRQTLHCRPRVTNRTCADGDVGGGFKHSQNVCF
ncbi:unnamed protein product [Polarella glacialis]|uniref:Uncharacterized protein n=1 Tax=Polarella glacialis TaxID=89957 RepID=A0A813IH42_POLGL|nr:unnamed protein product [Polarella glacialis]